MRHIAITALVISVSVLSFVKCGSKVAKKENKGNSDSTCQPIIQPVYANISATVNKTCAGATCHSGTDPLRQNLMSEIGLKNNASLSLTKVQANQMPPNQGSITACEKSNLINYLMNPNASPAPSLCTTAIATPTYAQISTIVSSNCAVSGCHDGVTVGRQDLRTEPNLVTNKTTAMAKMQANTMPPAPKVLTACDKQNLLNFFQTH